MTEVFIASAKYWFTVSVLVYCAASIVLTLGWGLWEAFTDGD